VPEASMLTTRPPKPSKKIFKKLPGKFLAETSERYDTLGYREVNWKILLKRILTSVIWVADWINLNMVR
jgi:hypothetical protein